MTICTFRAFDRPLLNSSPLNDSLRHSYEKPTHKHQRIKRLWRQSASTSNLGMWLTAQGRLYTASIRVHRSSVRTTSPAVSRPTMRPEQLAQLRIFNWYQKEYPQVLRDNCYLFFLFITPLRVTLIPTVKGAGLLHFSSYIITKLLYLI